MNPLDFVAGMMGPGRLRVVRHLTRAEVEREWAAARRAGRHGSANFRDFPAQSSGDEWVEVEAPIEWFHFDWQDDGPSGPKLERAEDYAASRGRFPPGIATFKERSLRRGVSQAFVSDGNHRGLAAQIRGDRTFRAYMPLEDVERLRSAHE